MANRPETPAAFGGGRFDPAFVAVALVGILVVFQGGYYAGAVCAVSLASAAAYAAFAVARHEPRPGFMAAPFLAIASICLLSAVFHGATLTMLQEVSTWFALAGMCAWCSPATAKGKGRALEALSAMGVALAGAGILMYVGALPVEGAVSNGRLMFTFQYANTAGLFFSVIAVLCLCNPRRRCKAAAVVPFAALCLTKSVGAAAVFAVAVAVLAVCGLRGAGRFRMKAAAVAAVAFAACVLAALLVRDRMGQAAQTFIERVVQMADAWSLLLPNMALGIGPDQWQFAYPAVQTAQYRAADVHCSYLQVALDGGVPALLALLGLVIAGIAGLVRRRELPALLCAAMLAVHALFDFDMQFAAVMLLLALLLSEPRDARERGARWGRAARALCWAAVALSAVASWAGVALDAQMAAIQDAVDRMDARQAEERAYGKPYLHGDVAVREAVAGALYAAGAYQDAIDLAQGDGPADTASLAVCRALGQHGLGQDGQAVQTLSGALHDYPYDVELYKAVGDYIAANELGADFVEAYNKEVDRANSLSATGRAAWLANQETFERVEGVDGE